MPSRLELLRQVPLFATLDADGIERLDQAVEEKRVPEGTVITHEGRHEGYFFVIVEGRVRIERGGKAINTLGPGDFLGEIALLDGGPRTATATAETACQLLTLPHDRFHRLIDGAPEIRKAVLEAVGAHLRRIDDEAAV
jgi:CRP/FNR family transcriptional regulator, cyclic AMP receptor protein